MMSDGKATVKMTDIAAKTSVRYVTTGWIVHRDPRFGFPAMKPFGTIPQIKSDYSYPNPPIPGKPVASFFNISESELRQALQEAGMLDLHHQELLYVSAIFQIMEQQTLLPKKYYSYKEIVAARKWANPGSLMQYYDVQVRFDSAVYPSTFLQKTTNGMHIKQSELGSYAAGATVHQPLQNMLVHDGKPYQLHRSYVIVGSQPMMIADKSTLMRTIVQPIGGFQLVAEYEPKTITKTTLPEERIQISSYHSDISANIVVGSNLPGSELFDVRTGIPAGQQLYVRAKVPSYVLEGSLAKISGTHRYDVPISKTFTYRWIAYNSLTKEWEHRTTSETIKMTVPIDRNYEYWRVDRAALYALQEVQIENESFPGGSVHVYGTMPPLNDTRFANHDSHTEMWTRNEIQLNTVELDGGKSGKPPTPEIDYIYETNEHIPPIRCRNDLLMIDGQLIMGDDWRVTATKEPLSFDDASVVGKRTDDRVLQSMRTDVSNGTKLSKGNMVYRLLHAIGTMPTRKTIPVQSVNEVVIHTPVINHIQIETDSSHIQVLHKKNQLPHVALGRFFDLRLSHSGQHRDISGYGLRDYRAFVANRSVTFPFDVYMENTLVPKFESILLPTHGTIPRFRVPEWVTEGNYTVVSTAISPACLYSKCTAQPHVNLSLQYGNATSTVEIVITGRLFGFRFTDQIRKLPQIASLGTYIHFRVSTMGDYSNMNAGVKIIPTFYFVRRDGTSREKVSLFYENEDGRYVKIGSSEDTIKRIVSLQDVVRNIRAEEWDKTKSVLLSFHVPLPMKKTSIANGATLRIPASMRTFDGITDHPHSVQHWYSSYHLPAKINVISSTTNRSLSLKDGFLIVNFSVETVKNQRWDDPTLTYFSVGKWNQWTNENFPTSVNWKGAVLPLLPGDVLIYDSDMKSETYNKPRISN